MTNPADAAAELERQYKAAMDPDRPGVPATLEFFANWRGPGLGDLGIPWHLMASFGEYLRALYRGDAA